MLVTRKLTSLTFVLITVISNSVLAGPFSLTVIRKGKDFSFPILKEESRKQVAKKINRMLQLGELMLLAEHRPKDIFGRVSIDDGRIYGGKVGIETTTYANDHNRLSLGFVESSCGMTCAYWHRFYTFNAGNGDRIDLKDLFTAAGYERFSRRVVAKRSVLFRREVKRKISPAKQEASLGPLGTIEADELDDFYIRGNSIFIDGENCLSKSEKFDGLEMVVRFDLREFKPYLNQYGRTLFGLNRGDIAKFHSNGLPQLFEGNVGDKWPIVMLLRKLGEDEVEGVYAYVNCGQGIALNGTFEKGTVELVEESLTETPFIPETNVSHRYTESGSISGHLDQTQLTGTWTDLGKTRTYKIQASKN